MRPKERRQTGQSDLFRARLDQIVDLDHPVAKLARAIEWRFLEEQFGAVYTMTLICWSPWRMLTHAGRRKAIAPDRTGGLFWTGPSTFFEDDR